MCSLLAEVQEESVVAGVLAAERLALPRAALDGGAGHPLAVELEGEVGVAAHDDAAPQLGLVPRGAAPGAAYLVGAHEDVDVVQLVEDGQDRVQRHLRPVPPPLLLRGSRRRCFPAAAPIAGATAARGRGHGVAWCGVRGHVHCTGA